MQVSERRVIYRSTRLETSFVRSFVRCQSYLACHTTAVASGTCGQESDAPMLLLLLMMMMMKPGSQLFIK